MSISLIKQMISWIAVGNRGEGIRSQIVFRSLYLMREIPQYLCLWTFTTNFCNKRTGRLSLFHVREYQKFHRWFCARTRIREKERTGRICGIEIPDRSLSRRRSGAEIQAYFNLGMVIRESDLISLWLNQQVNTKIQYSANTFPNDTITKLGQEED